MKDEGREERRDLRARPMDFALRIVRLYQALPKRGWRSPGPESTAFAVSTFVAADWREACPARSNPDFINHLEGGSQELDETDLWLELPGDAGTIKGLRTKPLRTEFDQLIAIFVTMIRKIKGPR